MCQETKTLTMNTAVIQVTSASLLSQCIDDSSDEDTDDERNSSTDEFIDGEESNESDSKDHACKGQEYCVQMKRVH